MYILPRIIKEELGEDIYNEMSKICNQPRPEKRWVIYGSAESIDKLNKMIDESLRDEFKHLINNKDEETNKSY